MKHLWSAIGVSFIAALLAACGGASNTLSAGPPLNPALIDSRHADVAKDNVLYAFKGGKDGATPEAPLVSVGGAFYGTTENGGGATACSGGCGTIFKIGPSGSGYKVLRDFKGGKDGAVPVAGLISDGGMLYGTTVRGGGAGCSSSSNRGCGTIFEIAPSGSAYKILYKFKGYTTDGALPFASLIAHGGMLYGVTVAGGGSGNSGSGWGTVFQIAPSGSGYKTLYAFKGSSDAAIPQGGLIVSGGALYGTSVYGGGATACSASCGTVFKIALSGSDYKVLYAFKGHKDGAHPTSGLVADGGMLYGTTVEGGSKGAGNGTVFQIAPSGSGYKKLYAFKGGKDGAFVQAGLIAKSGSLYGATLYGGTGCPTTSVWSGCGTLFKLNEAGSAADDVLYRFKAGGDGAFPYANLLYDGGTLYGTTVNGGGATKCTTGCGTVFTFAP